MSSVSDRVKSFGGFGSKKPPKTTDPTTVALGLPSAPSPQIIPGAFPEAAALPRPSSAEGEDEEMLPAGSLRSDARDSKRASSGDKEAPPRLSRAESAIARARKANSEGRRVDEQSASPDKPGNQPTVGAEDEFSFYALSDAQIRRCVNALVVGQVLTTWSTTFFLPVLPLYVTEGLGLSKLDVGIAFFMVSCGIAR